jgi:hypothetical protein
MGAFENLGAGAERHGAGKGESNDWLFHFIM